MLTLKISETDCSSPRTETHPIERAFLRQSEALAPLTDCELADDVIPIQVANEQEFAAAQSMIIWMKREQSWQIDSIHEFHALAVLADKYIIPRLQDDLTV